MNVVSAVYDLKQVQLLPTLAKSIGSFYLLQRVYQKIALRIYYHALILLLSLYTFERFSRGQSRGALTSRCWNFTKGDFQVLM